VPTIQCFAADGWVRKASFNNSQKFFGGTSLTLEKTGIKQKRSCSISSVCAIVLDLLLTIVLNCFRLHLLVVGLNATHVNLHQQTAFRLDNFVRLVWNLMSAQFLHNKTLYHVRMQLKQKPLKSTQRVQTAARPPS